MNSSEIAPLLREYIWQDIEVAALGRQSYCGLIGDLVHAIPSPKVGYLRRTAAEPSDGEPFYGDFYLVIAAGEDPHHEAELVAGLASYQLECTDNTIRFVEDQSTHELHLIVAAEALGVRPSPHLPAVFKTMAATIAHMLDLKTVRLDVYDPGYLAHPEGVWSPEGDSLTIRRYKQHFLEYDFCDEGVWYFIPDRVLRLLLIDEHARNGLDFLRELYAKAAREVDEMAATLPTDGI